MQIYKGYRFPFKFKTGRNIDKVKIVGKVSHQIELPLVLVIWVALNIRAAAGKLVYGIVKLLNTHSKPDKLHVSFKTVHFVLFMQHCNGKKNPAVRVRERSDNRF